MAKSDAKLKCPPGLSPAEREAWEKAALKSGGGFWPSKDPQEGETYVGNFVALAEVPNSLGKKGETQRKYSFQNDGVTTSIYGTSVLNSELDSLDLAVGDRVLILYKGRSANAKKGRKPAKIFSAVKLDGKRSKR